MTKGGFPDFASKKAFEIGYALFRIADNANHRGLAEYLESWGLRLIDFSSVRDYNRMKDTLAAVEGAVHLASGTGRIHPATSEVLLKELRSFNLAIIEFGNSEIASKVDLEDVFGKEKFAARASIQRKSGNEVRNPEIVSEQAVQLRRSEIMARIRQMDNFRIKDLQDQFPDLSDRTLRYDLQGLIENGLIEKIGSGPATYYRAVAGPLENAANKPEITVSDALAA